MKPMFVFRFGLLALLGIFLIQPAGMADDKNEWGSLKGRIVLDAPKAPAPQELNVTKDQNHCLSKGKLFSEDLVFFRDDAGRPGLGGHLYERLAHLPRMSAGFERAGSSNQGQRMVVAQSQIADRNMMGRGKSSGAHGAFIAEARPDATGEWRLR